MSTVIVTDQSQSQQSEVIEEVVETSSNTSVEIAEIEANRDITIAAIQAETSIANNETFADTERYREKCQTLEIQVSDLRRN